MEILDYDVIIFSVFAAIAFAVFAITSIKEFSKMSKEDYAYDPNERKFGRNAIYDWLASLGVDKAPTKQEKIKIMEKAIADMESGGVHFPDPIKEKLKKEILDKEWNPPHWFLLGLCKLVLVHNVLKEQGVNEFIDNVNFFITL